MVQAVDESRYGRIYSKVDECDSDKLWREQCVPCVPWPITNYNVDASRPYLLYLGLTKVHHRRNQFLQISKGTQL